MTNGIAKLLRVDIDKPKYDMNTYIGRAKHYFLLVNPLNILVSDSRLQRAREVVRAYRLGIEVPYVNTIEEVWREKYLYDSAFHPVTGEKMFILGRMSAQMPANTFLSGCMMIFYKKQIPALFFQWLNQTFNAVVNYTNRSGESKLTTEELLVPYISATFGALAATLTLSHLTKFMPSILARLVPFASVAAANCVNVPLMRQNELKYGISLFDKTDCLVGKSRKAAAIAIFQVVLSRIIISLPVLTFPPLIVERFERNGFLIRHPKWSGPLQIGLIGVILLFATPLGCAFFRQKTCIKVADLEYCMKKRLQNKCPNLRVVYYHKGL